MKFQKKIHQSINICILEMRLSADEIWELRRKIKDNCILIIIVAIKFSNRASVILELTAKHKQRAIEEGFLFLTYESRWSGQRISVNSYLWHAFLPVWCTLRGDVRNRCKTCPWRRIDKWENGPCETRHSHILETGELWRLGLILLKMRLIQWQIAASIAHKCRGSEERRRGIRLSVQLLTALLRFWYSCLMKGLFETL